MFTIEQLSKNPRLIDRWLMDKDLEEYGVVKLMRALPKEANKRIRVRMNGEYISNLLRTHPWLHTEFDPEDFKKLDEGEISDILGERPELSLFFKYLNTQYQDAAYYCTFPSEILKLDEEEKYELSKKMVELIRKEKR